VESLSRFDVEPRRPPDAWFKAAHDAGVGLVLELRAIENALGALSQLPLEVSLSLNASPDLLVSGRFDEALSGLELSRVVLEITEHASVLDYDALLSALAPLRARGARLAIDDAGAGYASMRHILNLRADVIKLDMSLTRDIDKDAGRRALAKGLIAFAHEIQSTITAEGVETQAELATLRALGADKVQGYFLGKPRALEEIIGARASQIRAAG
jgi:EAL domain-containing protein (putative c-di-GMP-specific phosphodiesterase class I)